MHIPTQITFSSLYYFIKYKFFNGAIEPVWSAYNDMLFLQYHEKIKKYKLLSTGKFETNDLYSAIYNSMKENKKPKLKNKANLNFKRDYPEKTMLNKSLKSIRLFNRLSQTDMADLIGVKKSQISEIESGRRAISQKTVEKYSIAFDIPVSSIYFLSEKLERKDSNFISKKVLDIFEWISSDEPEAPNDTIHDKSENTVHLF